MVEPEGSPGVYMARLVATLENKMSSLNVPGSEPMVGKSSLVAVPLDKLVARKGGSRFIVSSNGGTFVTRDDVGILNAGSGECQPELPEGDLPVAITSHRKDLQAGDGSRPVENSCGNQADTIQIRAVQTKQGQGEIKELEPIGERNYKRCKKRNSCKMTQVLGYVPIQVINLSL
jgi:hypothetical protein